MRVERRAGEPGGEGSDIVMGESDGGDTRNANPDHLEELANKLHPAGDGGVYGRLTEFFERARNLDASAEMASLRPLLTWLVDAASQLRDGAAILRGDDPPAYLSDLIAGYDSNDGVWTWEVHGQANADEIIALADQDDLSEDELERLRSKLADFAEYPDFAAYLVDEMGVEEYLALCDEVNAAAAQEGASDEVTELQNLLTTTLTSAFSVPGDKPPGSEAYENWIRDTPQGQRYVERQEALAAAGPAWAADLVGQGENLTGHELDTLNAVLDAGKNNEDFAADFATTLGARNLLEAWNDLTVPDTAPETEDASDARRERLADMQQNLGVLLGTATRSDHQGMDQWQTDLISLGDEPFGEPSAAGWQPYGFQLMGSLMQHGRFATDFLAGERGYGEALMAWEQDMGGAEIVTAHLFYYPTLLGDRFRKDPMVGFAEALGHNEDASRRLLSDRETFTYLVEERDWGFESDQER
jgi:hypothetical protein